MPAGTRRNAEGDLVDCYVQPSALHITVTEGGLEALTAFRRSAAHDVAFWAQLKSIGRYAKDMAKAAQRREKAATLWLNHFTHVGQRFVHSLPLGLATELDSAFRALSLERA